MDYFLKDLNGIFNRFIVEPKSVNLTWDAFVPDGFKLVETDEHKKQRLQKELQQKKQELSYHENKVQQLSKSISEQEAELKSLESNQ
jgi:septal ring factor EnvC (AmiA/AmiB activator)